MSYAGEAVRVRVPARSALLGNPSDGFKGATIAFAIPERGAELEARRRGEGVALEASGEALRFASGHELVETATAGEYPAEGPLALMMAAVKRLLERDGSTPAAGFELRLLRSTIPAQVGLAGSSAIVTGALRAVAPLLGQELGPAELPALALACESEELGIVAGLQDRVVQSHGGLLFMEFDPSLAPTGGRYEALDPTLLPPTFVAYLPRGARTGSGVTHARVRERFDRGEPDVVATMGQIAELARAGREALVRGERDRLGELMRRNVELRGQVYELDRRHLALVALADELGAPANYTGSGGAIVGLLPQDGGAGQLRAAFARRLGAELVLPKLEQPLG